MVLCGNAMEKLKKLSDESVDCCVTSPPYWCYAEGTEVLTNNGWKNIDSVKVDEKVLSCNPKNMNLEWVKVSAVKRWYYEGQMIHFINTHIDLLVTPNHKMLVYYRNLMNPTKPRHFGGSTEKYLVEAKDIKQGYITPKTKFVWIGKNPKYFVLPELKTIYNKQEKYYFSKNIKFETWLAFFGLWIAEGHVRGSKGGKKISYSIGIKQKKPNDKIIRKLLRKLPFSFNEYTDKRNIVTFEVSNKQIWFYFKQFGNSHTKYVPKQIKECSTRLLKIFLKWYLFGDGCVRNKNTTHEKVSCYSVSKRLKDDLSEIALKVGNNTSICKKNEVVFLRRKTVKLRDTMKLKQYEGYIYGLELKKYHTLCVRRNNKIVFSGNSLRDYKTEPLIWDGDPDCKHDFNYSTSKPSCGPPSDKSGLRDDPKQKQKENWAKGIKSKGMKVGFCKKCNAWKGSLGLESSFNLYTKHLCDIFDEVKRVLKKTGSLWVVIGDTYWGGGQGGADYGGKETTPGYAYGKIAKGKEYQKKSLCCVPERFIIEMVDRGWILRNKNIWWKRNSMPASVKDRFSVDWEYLFFFVKSNKTLFWTHIRELKITEKQPKPDYRWIDNLENIEYETKPSNYSDKTKMKCPVCNGTGIDTSHLIKIDCDNCNGKGKIKRWKRINLWQGYDYYFEQQFEDQQEISIKRAFAKDNLDVRKDKNNEQYTISSEKQKEVYKKMREQIKQGIIPKRNMRCVWDVPTHWSSLAHFAIFPQPLIDIPIRACSPEFICKKCGKPKVKIYESDWREHRNGNWKEAETKGKEMQRTDSHRQANVGGLTQITEPSNLTFKGYACCDCGAEFEGGVVLDPFAGVGTVGIVAQKLGRKYIMIDLSPDYVEMIKKNLQQGWLV